MFLCHSWFDFNVQCSSIHIQMSLNSRQLSGFTGMLSENFPSILMIASWLSTLTFLVEGVMLLLVACVGLVGNILSFTMLNAKGLQKIFHNLLLLLNIFDMVGT